MAFPLRYLSAALLGICIGGRVLLAQEPPAKEPPPPVFQVFSLIPVADMLYDLHGKAVTVSVGQNSYSPAYLTPEGGNLFFYRLVPAATPDLPPIRVPVATASVDSRKGAVSLVIFYPDGPPKEYDNAFSGPLKSLTLDNSPAAYPPGTVRILTFSSRPVVVKMGTSIVQLTTLRPTVMPYPSGNLTWLQVATTGPQGWQRVIGTPQMLSTDTRLSLFMRDIAPSINDPKPIGFLLKKIIEPMALPKNTETTTPPHGASLTTNR